MGFGGSGAAGSNSQASNSSASLLMVSRNLEFLFKKKNKIKKAAVESLEEDERKHKSGTSRRNNKIGTSNHKKSPYATKVYEVDD